LSESIQKAKSRALGQAVKLQGQQLSFSRQGQNS